MLHLNISLTDFMANSDFFVPVTVIGFSFSKLKTMQFVFN